MIPNITINNHDERHKIARQMLHNVSFRLGKLLVKVKPELTTFANWLEMNINHKIPSIVMP
jgi:hypothetical protein